MVSTRHHPRPFPDASTPNSDISSPSPAWTPSRKPQSNGSAGTASPSLRKRRADNPSTTSPVTSSKSTYLHTPPPLLVLWLLVSLPLVCWDTGYIMLRPHSMTGGKYHAPVWKPYALYATIDYVYGVPAFEAKSGFTAAQGSVNVIETCMYIYYLYMLYTHGRTGVFKVWDIDGFWKEVGDHGIQAEGMAEATLICFSAAVMTLSKTVLYWLHEYFSGFANIGHNSVGDTILLWIIPNGLWIVFPIYLIYVLGNEIIGAMKGSSAGKDE